MFGVTRHYLEKNTLLYLNYLLGYARKVLTYTFQIYNSKTVFTQSILSAVHGQIQTMDPINIKRQLARARGLVSRNFSVAIIRRFLLSH